MRKTGVCSLAKDIVLHTTTEAAAAAQEVTMVLLSTSMGRLARVARIFALWGAVLCLWAVMQAAACAQEASATGAALWLPDAQDARKALPNNATPPARREPATRLAPLPAADVGTIRRVALADGAKVVALTFDLCELDTVTTGCDMEILGFLRAEHIPATLFMGGKWMRTHARRVVQIMGEPQFEIANHAWSHGNFALLSPAGLRAQVLWTQAQYELLREQAMSEAKAQGRSEPAIQPVPTLFRLPYGRCNDQALQALASMGMQVVQWDVVAESGADNTNPEHARREAHLVASQVRPGSILLFHANLVPKGSARLLRETVAELRSKGYSFVTASTLLGMGKPQRTMNGYFTSPGDNKALDSQFGADGTGRHTPFTGN